MRLTRTLPASAPIIHPLLASRTSTYPTEKHWAALTIPEEPGLVKPPGWACQSLLASALPLHLFITNDLMRERVARKVALAPAPTGPARALSLGNVLTLYTAR